MTSDGNILIIDDDERNTFALSAILKTKGYSCITAFEARQGIDLLLKNDHIKIVLLDMMMPEIDGYEALEKIRHHDKIKTIPVVAVTAQAMTGDREKCLNAGASDYISKPVDIDELLTILKRHLK